MNISSSVEEALSSVGSACGDLARNSACYGYNDVLATFEQTTDPIIFQAPSDRTAVNVLESIGTSPMDTALEKWGIALMSLQANLPEALPGQNAVFMLLGNTQVENAVAPEDAFGGGALVNVLTNSAAGLFSDADSESEVIASIPGNRDLQADAISEDGGWVRVVYDGLPGWVTRNVLAENAEIDTLPVLTPETRTPMQAFYLRTNITGTDCTEAPDSLIVQGPQNLKIDINANGADIQLGSTIGLRVLGLTDELRALFLPYYAEIGTVTRLLEVFVIDGEAILNPGTPEEVVVPTGYRTYRCLSETDNLGLDEVDNDREVIPGCPWLPPMPWVPDDYVAYSKLAGVTLNYEIKLPPLVVPTLTPTVTLTPTPTNTQPVVVIPSTRTPTATSTVIPFDDTLTPTSTPTSPDGNFTEEPSVTDTPTPTATPEPDGVPPTNTDTPTATDTATVTLSATATDTATVTLTATATDTPATTPDPNF